MKLVYKACAGHTLLPRSLHLESHRDPVGVPPHSGGFGDVWKCEYRGREVAVKILRVPHHKGSQDVTGVSNLLDVIYSRVLIDRT